MSDLWCFFWGVDYPNIAFSIYLLPPFLPSKFCVCSTDSVNTHQRWVESGELDPEEGEEETRGGQEPGPGSKPRFPLLGDKSGQFGLSLDVFDGRAGVHSLALAVVGRR